MNTYRPIPDILSHIVKGFQAPRKMAVGLSKALNTSPELWLNMQRNYDLWIAEERMHDVEIRRIA